MHIQIFGYYSTWMHTCEEQCKCMPFIDVYKCVHIDRSEQLQQFKFVLFQSVPDMILAYCSKMTTESFFFTARHSRQNCHHHLLTAITICQHDQKFIFGCTFPAVIQNSGILAKLVHLWKKLRDLNLNYAVHKSNLFQIQIINRDVYVHGCACTHTNDMYEFNW